MQYPKLSEFLELCEKLPFLLGAFFGRYCISKDGSLFYTVSTFKKSKFINDDNFYEKAKKQYLLDLNAVSNFGRWEENKNPKIKNAQFAFVLENDLNLSLEQFFNKIYIEILCGKLFSQNGFTESKRLFLSAFFELRGSIDTSRQLLAQDFFFNNSFEARRMLLLSDIFEIPHALLNINFRELQPQFTSGENERNTQLRINLRYFAKQIGFLNIYKIEIMKLKYGFAAEGKNTRWTKFICEIPISRQKESIFFERINFYLNAIFRQKIDLLKLKILRDELGFNDDFNECLDSTKDINKVKRNANIIKIMRFGTDDICAACGEIYELKDRSFLDRHGRLYTEIHHVISLGQNRELDVIENLAKLCPVCHRALSSGSATEQIQKEKIAKILNNNPQNAEFAERIFGINEREKLIEKIYENLK